MRSSWIFWRKGTNAWRDSPFSDISAMRIWCIQNLRPCFLSKHKKQHQSIINMDFRASKIGSWITSISARFFQAMVVSWMLPSTMPPACRKPKGSGDDMCVVDTSEMEVISCCFKAATTKHTEVWKNTINENLHPTGTWTYLPHHGGIHPWKGTMWDYSKALPNISSTHFTTVSIGKPPCVWYGLASLLILIELYE